MEIRVAYKFSCRLQKDLLGFRVHESMDHVRTLRPKRMNILWLAIEVVSNLFFFFLKSDIVM